jgi:acetylornithine/N-succinyldiaminopimelate aminotransferase
MLSTRELFLANTAQTSPFPRLIEVQSAEGLYLITPKGKKIMDLVSGFNVSHLGHRNPAVIEAIKKQLDLHLHVTVYGEFVQNAQVQFATQLLSVLPPTFGAVYFTNSGAEATEGAMKVAKKFTGRSQFIAAKKAYHGSTQGALSLMGNEDYHKAYAPLLPGISFIDFNDIDQLQQIDQHTAAVILETVQGEAGVRVPDLSYMQAVRKRCDEVGALLILDEIQAAFGRTGTMFAFESFGIVPDILLLAKALGGGMPIGAFIAPKHIMDVIKDNPILGHITTFGGHPVSAAAGLAALEYLQKAQIVEDVLRKETLFRQYLKHSKIKEIRGKGLMLAMQLESFEQVTQVAEQALQNGVLVDWYLHCETAIRLAPPLTISDEEIKEACESLLRALDTLP